MNPMSKTRGAIDGEVNNKARTMIVGVNGCLGLVGGGHKIEPEQAMFVFEDDLGMAPSCSRAITAWVNTDPRARMLVSRSGRVQWVNDSAYRMLQDEGGLKVVDDTLIASSASVTLVLKDLLQQASHDSALYAITAMDAGRQWLLWAQQLIPGDDASIGLAAHRMADPVSYEAMLHMHHLTPCETRIVTMMLAGLETGRIAQKQDISMETLRTHIKHAYRKLGVKSRGELFAKAVDFAGL